MGSSNLSVLCDDWNSYWTDLEYSRLGSRTSPFNCIRCMQRVKEGNTFRARDGNFTTPVYVCFRCTDLWNPEGHSFPTIKEDERAWLLLSPL